MHGITPTLPLSPDSASEFRFDKGWLGFSLMRAIVIGCASKVSRPDGAALFRDIPRIEMFFRAGHRRGPMRALISTLRELQEKSQTIGPQVRLNTSNHIAVAGCADGEIADGYAPGLINREDDLVCEEFG